MKKKLLPLLLFLGLTTVAIAARIQNEDVKSLAQLQASVLTTTGNLSSGNACITSPASTTGLRTGLYIYDSTTPANIPSGTTIAGLPGTCSAGQIQMSQNAAGNGTGDTITFGGTSSQLINDTKIYVTANGLNKQLSAAITANELAGSAPAGNVVYGSGTGFTSNGSNFFLNSSSFFLGLGTGSPQDRLHVDEGNIRLTSASIAKYLGFYQASTQDWTIQHNVDRSLKIDSPGSRILSLNQTGGNVGVGTSTAENKFVVKGSGSIEYRHGTSNNVMASLGQRGGGVDGGYLALAALGTIKVGLDSDGTSFFTGGTVSVGTNSPVGSQGSLQVHNNSNAVSTFKQLASSLSSGYYTVEIDSSAHNSNLSTAGALLVRTNSVASALVVDGNGKLGVGSSSPVTKLHVGSSAGNGVITAFNHTASSTQSTDSQGTGSASVPAVASGTYTSTAIIGSNLSSVTPDKAQWMRVGNVVTMSGRIDIDPTAAGAFLFIMSMPVTSDFTAQGDAGGTGFTADNGVIVRINSDTSNNRLQFEGTAASGTATQIYYSVTYLVL